MYFELVCLNRNQDKSVEGFVYGQFVSILIGIICDFFPADRYIFLMWKPIF